MAPIFVLGLLWALWADWPYGVLLAGSATALSTLLLGSVGRTEISLIVSEPLAVMLFHFFLSAFRPDPRIARLRDVGVFIAAGFFASAAGASVAYGAVAWVAPQPAVELARMWDGWWVGRSLSMVLFTLPVAVLAGSLVEELKTRHFVQLRPHTESLRRQVLASSFAVLVLVVFVTSWTQASNAQLETAISATRSSGEDREELRRAFHNASFYQAIVIAGLVGLIASGVVLWLLQQRRFGERLMQEREEQIGHLRRKQLQLAAVQSISDATVRSLEPEGVAVQIAENMARIFAPASVSVYLRDPLDPAHLWRASQSESGGAAPMPYPPRMGMEGSLAGHIIWKGAAAILDVQDRSLPRSFLDEFQKLKARSCIGLPVLGEQAIVGVIQIGFDRPYEPEEDESPLYRMLGRAAGAALERAKAHATSRRRAEILDALYHATQELAGESEASPLMRCALRAAHRVLHAETATIVLSRTDPGGRKRLKVASVSGQPASEVPHPDWEFDAESPGLVAESIRDGQSHSVGVRPHRPHAVELAPGWTSSIAISAPLTGGRLDVLGAMVFTFGTGLAIGPEEMGVAEDLARQTAAGLRRALLLEETRRQAAELALFDQIGRALAESLRVTDTLTQLVQQVVKVFPSQLVGVLELDTERQALVLRTANQKWPGNSELLVPLTSESLAIQAFRSGQTYTSTALSSEQGAQQDPFAQHDFVSGIFIPLGTRAHPLGVLVGVDPYPREFGAQEIRRLEQVAGLASSALDRARLYDEVRTRVDELALHNKVAAVLVETPLLETSLRQIAELVRTHFRSAGAGFLLVEPNRQEVAVYGASGLQSKELRDLRMPLREGGFAKRVLDANRPIAVRDLRTDTRLSEPFRKALAQVHSALAIPMPASKAPLGILGIYEDREREYRPDEIQQLTGVARLAAAAVERGELGQALRATEARLHEILDGLPALVVSLDPGGRILSFNATSETLTGYRRDEVLSMPFTTLFITDADERRQMEGMLDVTLSGTYQESLVLTRLRCRDGSERRIRWSGRPLRSHGGTLDGVVAMGLDVTEQTQLEAQFLQAQKMESVGALAGGMAHGFNNLLGGILGQACLLRAQLGSTDPRREIVLKIEAAAQRGADLNRKLLAFARKSVLQPTPLNLGALVQETAELLAGSMPRSIAIETGVDPQAPLVMGDATQLQQIVLNLCVNARDAMPRGGRLSLRVTRESEEHVRLEIEDTGTGMSDEVKSHLFEPFYTSKEPGKGTGLGLAVVFGIVRSHGGTVSVESEEGKGTRFTIRFPATNATVPDAPCLETKTPERAAIEGHEKVLVIDDENIMRTTCAELLSDLGYRVETAPSGDEALEKVDTGRFMPEVIVLDLMMPGLSGVPLLRELQKRMPAVPVILISAFYNDAGVRDMLNAGARELVAKPFRIEDLAGAVRRAVDDRAERPA